MNRPPASNRYAALVLAIFSASASAFGQSAATDPVGFISVNVTGGSQSSPTLSLVSPTLLQPVDWQGPILTITGTTITVAGAPWQAGGFNGANGAYFVEIASGANAGAMTDIVTTTNNSLITSDDLSAFATVGSTIRIRKEVTLGKFLGVNNSAGLLGGASLANADEVLVYEGATPKVCFYYDGTQGGAAGWFDSLGNSAANLVISPHQGIVIRRKAGGSANILSFTSMGAVKTGNTLLPVTPGLNVLGTTVAKALTLATCGLFTGNATTGIKAGTQLANADELVLYPANGPATYWYYDGTQGGSAGWYDTLGNAAGTVAIPPGTSFVVNRKAPGTAFNWAQPSPTSF